MSTMQEMVKGAVSKARNYFGNDVSESRLMAKERKVNEVAHNLQIEREKYERAKDMRAVFTYKYERMTVIVAKDLGQGDFKDPIALTDLDKKFAKCYLDACQAYDNAKMSAASGDQANNDPAVIWKDVPQVWKAVFDAIGAGETASPPRVSVLQALILPMIAHIVHDLPLAIADTLMNEPSQANADDFDRINELMGGRFNEIQRQISLRYNWLLILLDGAALFFDEHIIFQTIRQERSNAWRDATRLLHARYNNDQEKYERIRESIIRRTLVYIAFYRAPSIWWLRLAFWLDHLALRLFMMLKWPITTSHQKEQPQTPPEERPALAA
ncbi:MAG: DUF5995 family protein [Anaerolineae bacterium]|nr:DUF5995 family protein [Anaerolineae bacterium]